MANVLVLPVTPTALPGGFCFTSFQQLLNDFSSHQSVTFPSSFAGVTASPTKPSDTTQAWLQLDSLGRPTRLFFFAQGAWLSMHPQVPGATMIWTSALPDFTTFDGGDANPVSPISGATWEEVTEMRAKFPIGVGTLPSGTVIAQGATGGEETHSLTVQELAPHTHPVSFAKAVTDLWAGNETGSGKIVSGDAGLSGGDEAAINSTAPFFKADSTGGNTATPPVVVAHNNVPPFFAIYLLRRTARLFYVV